MPKEPLYMRTYEVVLDKESGISGDIWSNREPYTTAQLRAKNFDELGKKLDCFYPGIKLLRGHIVGTAKHFYPSDVPRTKG